jgi:hypothetical protein
MKTALLNQPILITLQPRRTRVSRSMITPHVVMICKDAAAAFILTAMLYAALILLGGFEP